MAEQFSNEGSSTSNGSGEGSDSTVQLNIKTLDSQMYSFRVDKNMLVSAFKEKIAGEIGVPVGQQRLIFRGKVLKDEHLLSEYQVENGHTLHLVARQPTVPQSSANTSSADVNANNGSQGNDASSGIPQNRIGQISHSVVLGTFNVGDPGEGTVPDLSRVIGAVLNSFGMGGQTGTNGAGGMQFSTMPNVSSQTAQGNENAGAPRNSSDGQGQAGNQAESGQAFSGQSFQQPPQVMQIPPTAAIPLPTLHLPIPDSLSTLSEFMSRMEQALAQNGYQPNASSTSVGDTPRHDLTSHSQGLQSLIAVLQHAERLLSGHTVTALSRIAGRLEQDGASSDQSVRRQLQTESVQVGLAMQHLGALLLELGRTILTLRMGQSSAEASVNPGPAVYISPSGPNPIMVQPFPLQANSLFSGPAAQSNHMAFNPVGFGAVPRNINIHISAGTSLSPVVSAIGTRTGNGEAMQGERGNTIGSGQVRMLPVRNIIAATVPSRSTGIAVPTAAQPGQSVSNSQPSSDSTSLSSLVSEVNSRIRNMVDSMRGENQPLSGTVSSSAGNDTSTEQPSGLPVNGSGHSTVALPGLISEDDKKEQDEHTQGSNSEDKESLLSPKDVRSSSVECTSGETSLISEERSENVPSSSAKPGPPEGSQGVPLGLAMGSLDRKRRTRVPKSLVKSGDDATSNAPVSQNLDSGMSGHQVLQSVASRSSRVSADDTGAGQLPQSGGSNPESRPLGQQSSGAQFDAANVMSNVIHSPEMNGLLAGVSEQTGVGSPNVLRNMLQQLTMNPQIMSTVSQIAQQVESQDLGNMFSGLGSGQSGGIDLSRIMQQMMPVVSQVLGGGPASQPSSRVEPESQIPYNESRSVGNENPDGQNQNVQIDLQEVAQRIGQFNAPGDIFRSIAENAARLSGDDSRAQDCVHELSNNEDLVSDYVEMLQHDIRQRLEKDPGQD